MLINLQPAVARNQSWYQLQSKQLNFYFSHVSQIGIVISNQLKINAAYFSIVHKNTVLIYDANLLNYIAQFYFLYLLQNCIFIYLKANFDQKPLITTRFCFTSGLGRRSMITNLFVDDYVHLTAINFHALCS